MKIFKKLLSYVLLLIWLAGAIWFSFYFVRTGFQDIVNSLIAIDMGASKIIYFINAPVMLYIGFAILGLAAFCILHIIYSKKLSRTQAQPDIAMNIVALFSMLIGVAGILFSILYIVYMNITLAQMGYTRTIEIGSRSFETWEKKR
jgi:hypothetical protein